MSSFGQVIPVIGTINGFLGEVSRTGGGDPFIVSKQANVNNGNNINFGDPVVLLPDSTGGTYKQFSDWQTNGGGLQVGGSGFNNASTTVTPGNLTGIAPGMLIFNAGIPAGTYVVSINPVTGTAVLSKTPTGSNNANTTFQFAQFAGFAVRETKSQLGYNSQAGGAYTAPFVGQYTPGQYVGVLVRGGITIKVQAGTPITGGPAYLRAITNGNNVIGGIEANNDGNNNLLLPNLIAEAYFKTGTKDSNNLSELTILSRLTV